MPKIEVYQDALFVYIGSSMNDDELAALLESAKGELDEPANADGLMKIELNDTNRPDLWSTAGLGRQLRIHRGGALPEYDFLSTRESSREAGERTVVVDPNLEKTRPFIAAFAVSGKPIEDADLKDLIQSQEKLCTNYGRHRKSIAMGVYRTDLIQFPIRYQAVDPDATRFVPLGMEEELNLREIIAEHPKGQEFGPIVADFQRMPFITDSRGEVLSFPPVINSARVGAVEVGDENLFIELTGTDIESLLLACLIVACDLSDAGHTIHPVAVEYPYKTPLGKRVVTPFYFQQPTRASLRTISTLLGEQMSAETVSEALQKMGVAHEVSDGSVDVCPPAYRNDFLHEVDVAEDVMMGRGMASFQPEMPSDFTIGRLTPGEEFGREVIQIMVGLGFQEMIFPYLGSEIDLVQKLRPVPLGGAYDGPDQPVIRISNPMSENYACVRSSILPYLLQAESVSGHAVYPHSVFEVGKVVRVAAEDDHGVSTIDSLGFITADADASFTQVSGQLSVLFHHLSCEYQVTEAEDPRFIPGRAAEIKVDGTSVGVMGEVHPQVLENFGIQTPCTACDIDLTRILHMRSTGR
jgi:phenylalanyl-tRNA synthetase beta chain